MTTPTPDPYAVCGAFNTAHPLGTPVLAWPGVRDDTTEPLRTRTRSGAWPLAGHPVVMVDGHAGGIALTHIEHDPTRRPAVPEVELPMPPCPICTEDLDSDGDGLTCEPCGAGWTRDGSRGEWDDPAAVCCPAKRTAPWRPGPDAMAQCLLPAGHDTDRHLCDPGGDWDDTERCARVDGQGNPFEPRPDCSECKAAPTWWMGGMCPPCYHNAVRSGWTPGAGQ